jgi:hypothetical protein
MKVAVKATASFTNLTDGSRLAKRNYCERWDQCHPDKLKGLIYHKDTKGTKNKATNGNFLVTFVPVM